MTTLVDRHLIRPEKLIEPMRPHSGCKGMRQGVGPAGEALGGCPVCWSKTTWRWNCSSCGYRTAWVEDNVAANEEIAAWAAHAPGLTGSASFGHMPQWWEAS